MCTAQSGPQPMIVWAVHAEGSLPRVWVVVKANPDFIPQVSAQKTVLFSNLSTQRGPFSLNGLPRGLKWCL